MGTPQVTTSSHPPRGARSDPDPDPNQHQDQGEPEGVVQTSVMGDAMGESVPVVHRNPLPSGRRRQRFEPEPSFRRGAAGNGPGHVTSRHS